MLSTLLVLFLAVVPTAHAGSSWFVDGAHGGDGNDCMSFQHACKTIGHAITLASSGDSVFLAGATYQEIVTVSFSLNVIGSASSAAQPVVIDGQARNTVVTISKTDAQVTLSNLTIQNGTGQINGGGVKNAGTLTIFNSTIVANTIGVGGDGGGIYNTGTLTLNNSNVLYNSGNNGGGIYGGPGALTLNNTTVSGNSGSNGGGIYGAGTLTISNSAIWGNSASNGGGIGDAGLGGTATIVNSTIYGNSGSNGGGIYNTSRTLTVSNGSFGFGITR
jgi:predicted outer membrane repeat protein